MGMVELWGAQPAPHGGHSATLPSQPQPGPMPTCWGLFWITTRELPVPGCQLAPLHGKQLLSPHVLAQQHRLCWCCFPLLLWAGNSSHPRAFLGERHPHCNTGTSGRQAMQAAGLQPFRMATLSALCFYQQLTQHR